MFFFLFFFFFRRIASALRLYNDKELASIINKKSELIKASLRFAINHRRKIQGLAKIDFSDASFSASLKEMVSIQDEAKLIKRRERNKIAARKCREKRKMNYFLLAKVSLTKLSFSLSLSFFLSFFLSLALCFFILAYLLNWFKTNCWGQIQ